MEPADRTLDRLLVLDGAVMEMGGGFWVSIKAVRIEPAGARPHGVNYSLCLFGPDDERIICFDNAHPVAIGRGPARRKADVSDHVHAGERIRPYAYTSAEQLLVDFWDAVFRSLKEKGIP